jgi:hypothetical protein
VGGLTPETSAQLSASAVQTYQDYLFEQGLPITAIFTQQSAVLDESVANWIGLPPISEGPARYDLSAVQHRVGILTHPGVIAAITAQDVASMVGRGLFVLEHVFCSSMAAPPASVNTGDFLNHLAPDATQRDYAEDRATRPQCAGCHAQFDPLAFGLEIFDTAGRIALQNEAGKAHRTDGQINNLEGAPAYQTVEEYVGLLAGSAEVQRCLVKQHLQFALGRPVDQAELSSVQYIAEQSQASDNSYATLMGTLIQHPIFTTLSTE